MPQAVQKGQDHADSGGHGSCRTAADTNLLLLAELANAVTLCRQYPSIILVAERIETADHLERARSLGFDLFQGYVLSRPQVVPARALSPSRLRRIELLGLLVGPEIPLTQVVRLVTGDPALSIRLLAVANATEDGVYITGRGSWCR